MSSRTFFSFALLLPIVAALAGLLSSALRVLVVPLIFGGVPYILFAIALLFQIRRAPTKSRLVRLSIAAPPFFVPFVVAFVLIAGGGAPRMFPLTDIATQMIPFAVYTLIFGYLYVAIAWGLWALARRIGVVHDDRVT